MKSKRKRLVIEPKSLFVIDERKRVPPDVIAALEAISEIQMHKVKDSAGIVRVRKDRL